MRQAHRPKDVHDMWRLYILNDGKSEAREVRDSGAADCPWFAPVLLAPQEPEAAVDRSWPMWVSFLRRENLLAASRAVTAS